MCAQNVPTDGQEPVHGPDHGVGEFRGGSPASMRGVIVAFGFSFHSGLDLVCDPSATRRAVAHAADVLRDWGVPRNVAADAVLIVDELVTNAVRHSGAATERGRPGVGSCGLGLWTYRGHLVICVHDETDQVPVLRDVSLDAENGRGLQIVAGLSEGVWGYAVQPSQRGKLVWAQLPLPNRAPGPEERQMGVVA